MEYERRNAYSNPHWKGDGSYNEDTDCRRSFRIPARALNIIWGNDSRFWQWIELTEEDTQSIGFKEGALLLQVNWIEVTGKLDVSHVKLPLGSRYRIYYIVKFRVDAFGWHSVPIKFKVRHNGEETEESIILEPYRAKHDVWHEIPGGELSLSHNSDGIIEFGMFEVETEWWKGCMVLGGIRVGPKVG